MQPRCVQTPTTTSHSGFLTRADRSAGPAARRAAPSSAALIVFRRAVADEHRLAAPLHVQRLADRRPAPGRPRSMDSASTSAAGFMLSISGQATLPTPTAPTAPVSEIQEVATGACPRAGCVIRRSGYCPRHRRRPGGRYPTLLQTVRLGRPELRPRPRAGFGARATRRIPGRRRPSRLYNAQNSDPAIARRTAAATRHRGRTSTQMHAPRPLRARHPAESRAR